MTLAVADAGPISHLQQLDSLDLLADVDLLVPEPVIEELDAGNAVPGDESLAYEAVTVDRPITADDLEEGERAAIAVARNREALLLTDDLDARRKAAEMGIEVHGSVGIIVRGYARGTVRRDTAVELLWELQEETSLFVSDAVIERGIALLDEDNT